MCEVCGCGDARRVSLDLQTSLLDDNDHEAAHLREHFELTLFVEVRHRARGLDTTRHRDWGKGRFLVHQGCAHGRVSYHNSQEEQ